MMLVEERFDLRTLHSARFSISLISVLRLHLAREILVLDSDAAISSGNAGPETCGMRRVQTQGYRRLFGHEPG